MWLRLKGKPPRSIGHQIHKVLKDVFLGELRLHCGTVDKGDDVGQFLPCQLDRRAALTGGITLIAILASRDRW